MKLLILAVFAIVSWTYRRLHLPEPFGARDCQGRNWKREFPEVENQEIREFLLLFVDAFSFSKKEKLKLNPEDRILDIYRKLYPIKGWPDGLELETLERDVLKKYGFQLRKIWDERLTLGKLFSQCAVSKAI